MKVYKVLIGVLNCVLDLGFRIFGLGFWGFWALRFGVLESTVSGFSVWRLGLIVLGSSVSEFSA